MLWAPSFLKTFSSQLLQVDDMSRRGKLVSRTGSSSGHQVLQPKGCTCLQPSARHGPFLCLPKAQAYLPHHLAIVLNT